MQPRAVRSHGSVAIGPREKIGEGYRVILQGTALAANGHFGRRHRGQTSRITVVVISRYFQVFGRKERTRGGAHETNQVLRARRGPSRSQARFKESCWPTPPLPSDGSAFEKELWRHPAS
jgi:hypothetical protein